MAELRIKYEHPTKILVSIGNLAVRDKTVDDITDVVFMFKDTIGQSDTAAPFKKTLGSGVVIAFGRLEVTIDKADFGATKLVSGSVYIVAVGIEFNGSGIFIEQIDDDQKDIACIIPDRVRA